MDEDGLLPLRPAYIHPIQSYAEFRSGRLPVNVGGSGVGPEHLDHQIDKPRLRPFQQGAGLSCLLRKFNRL